MLKKSTLFAAMLILLLINHTHSRKYDDTINLFTFRREGSFVFLDRIHLDPGYMTVTANIKMNLNNIKQGASYNLQIVAVPQSIWPTSLSTKCNEIGLTVQQLQLKKAKEIVFDMHFDSSNMYTTGFASTLQVSTQQTYNFILRDCSRALVNDGYGRDSKLAVTLDVKNNDSHISSGEGHYAWLLPLLVLCGSAMIWFLGRQKEQEGDNWIKLLVKISLWMGVSSILIKYIGFLLYAYTSGVEHQVFDFFYLLLHSCSDSILIVLIMLLSYGWTVTFKNARDFDLYVPLACMLGLINIIMTVLNKISDGEHDKYHMFDSIPAYIMITFRLIGLLVFLIGIGRSWADLKKNKNPEKLKQYLLHLTALGLLYLTFVPLGFVGIRYVDNRYKKETMFFWMEMTRFCLTIWLGLLAGWKKSAYRSIIDGSFMEKAQKYF